jgi:hypothetical protein
MGAVGICPVASHVFPLAKTVPTAQTYEGGPPRGGIFALSGDRSSSDAQGRAPRSSLPETAPEDEPGSYVSVGCLARTRLHKETGKRGLSHNL